MFYKRKSIENNKNDDEWKQIYNLSEKAYVYDYFHNNVVYFYDNYYKVFVAKVLSKLGYYIIVSQDGTWWYPNKPLESLICLMKVNYSEWNY